jgi:hypothetical protein
MTRSLRRGIQILLVLALTGACAKSGQLTAAVSSAANTTTASTEPPFVEGSFAPGGSTATTEVSLNANPLIGATEMKSWDQLVAAVEQAAKTSGVRIALVDPRPALGSNPSIFFNGLSAAFVGTDLTVTEGLGATGDPYLDQLVTRVNASRTNPHLRASRMRDSGIDCALMPSETVDELVCGVAGTQVDLLVPHTDTSATSVASIARAITPDVTMINPTGNQHP